jgi:hypothetical protein
LIHGRNDAPDRSPAGKFKKASRSFTRSSQTLIGCLVSTAVRALPCATSGVVGPAGPSSSAS